MLNPDISGFENRVDQNLPASQFNRGVSHYRILPISRDIGWPVQQLDYFRYIKQHILSVDLTL